MARWLVTMSVVLVAVIVISDVTWLQLIWKLPILAILLTWIFSKLRPCLPRAVLGTGPVDRDSKAVFITGCDSGFGNGLARRLDKLGFRVFAGCLSADSASCQQLTAESSNRLRLVPCDVTDQLQVQAARQLVEAALNNSYLHALVNNAGVATVSGVEFCPIEDYQKMLEVNFLGSVRVTKTFLPLLRNRTQPARVVFAASVASRTCFPNMTAYSSSKAALVSFAEGLRREMHRFRISVHTVEPGGYRTSIMTESLLNEVSARNWHSAGDEIRTVYGEQYMNANKAKCVQILNSGLSLEAVYEVVDDLLDATVGENPQLCYVPNTMRRTRNEILTSLPTSALDWILRKTLLPTEAPNFVKTLV